MATVVPPPSKRQRREQLEKTQTQQDVTAVAPGEDGSFKARFVDSDGNQMAEVIEVPLADASEKNISLLLNTLMDKVRVICPGDGPVSPSLPSANWRALRTARTSSRIGSASTSPTQT